MDRSGWRTALRALPAACLAAAALLSGSLAQADTLAEIRALSNQGELQQALQLADSGLASNPQDAALRFLRGVILMELQRDGEAMTIFTQLNQEFPELPDPLNNIALLQARAGRLDEALQSLLAALRNDPSHRLARINLGQIHLMLAARAWDEAATAAPLEPELQRRLQAVRALLPFADR